VEGVHAVKFTNANIAAVLEIDPDAIAATVDTFCYVGETEKVDVIGQRRYMINGYDQMDWTMRFGKSFEEIRLLHYYPQLIGCHSLKVTELELREKSVFKVCEKSSPSTESRRRSLVALRRGSPVRMRPPLGATGNGTKLPTSCSLGKSSEGTNNIGDAGNKEKFGFANGETKSFTVKSDTSELKLGNAKSSIDDDDELVLGADAQLKGGTAASLFKSPTSLKGHMDSEFPTQDEKGVEDCLVGIRAKSNSDLKECTYPSDWQVKVRPKPELQAASSDPPVQTEMDQNLDKPTDGVREFGLSESGENDVVDMYDVQPIVSTIGRNLGQYEEDTRETIVSLLSNYCGLSYLRNPYDCRELSVAMPSDTLIGVWDHFESFCKVSRIVPHGKGKLMTTDDRVIYVGDFKNGKRYGFGTALVVEKWTDPYHGIGYYQGNWVDNCRHGFGCLELASGLRYNGEWYLDRPQGKGMLIYPDGSILKGYFAGGLCEGSFTHYSSSGHVDLLDFRRGCLVKSEPLRQMNYCEDVPCSLSKTMNLRQKEKVDDEVLLLEKNLFSTERQKEQLGRLSSLSDVKKKIESITNQDAIAAKDEGSVNKNTCFVANVEENPTEVWENNKNDETIAGEVDLDDLLEHLLNSIQLENEFFIKHQMSKVKLYCEDMLSIAAKELEKISVDHRREVVKLDTVNGTRKRIDEVSSKVDEMTGKFDGVVNLCESILDGLEKTGDRISALDVHVAEISEGKERETIESLKEVVKKKEGELSEAESALNCHICQDRRRDCVVMPCMHMETCSKCIRRLRQQSSTVLCPICRGGIRGEIHIESS